MGGLSVYIGGEGPSGFWMTSTSRKASWASDSLSTVNWIVASMVLMWRWKSSMWRALRAQQVSLHIISRSWVAGGMWKGLLTLRLP